MFQSATVPFGKYTKISVHDPASGAGFSVVPEAGANVTEIFFNGFQVLDGYATPEDLQAAKWGKSVLLFPFPNRLLDGRYEWQGKSYAFAINNADTGNAIHGFIRHQAFSVEEIRLRPREASVALVAHCDGKRADYPFPCVFRAVFSINNKNRFNVVLSCKNLHDAPIPVGLGWHPYFRLCEKADEHHMQLPAAAMVDIDARMIPTGARTPYARFEKMTRLGDTFLDNCFEAAAATPRYKMILSGGKHRVTMSAHRAQWPFFQVFTPPHRASVALEPMSCNVDAFNNGEGLASLAPGKTLRSQFDVAYSSEK